MRLPERGRRAAADGDRRARSRPRAADTRREVAQDQVALADDAAGRRAAHAGGARPADEVGEHRHAGAGARLHRPAHDREQLDLAGADRVVGDRAQGGLAGVGGGERATQLGERELVLDGAGVEEGGGEVAGCRGREAASERAVGGRRPPAERFADEALRVPRPSSGPVVKPSYAIASTPSGSVAGSSSSLTISRTGSPGASSTSRPGANGLGPLSISQASPVSQWTLPGSAHSSASAPAVDVSSSAWMWRSAKLHGGIDAVGMRRSIRQGRNASA